MSISLSSDFSEPYLSLDEKIEAAEREIARQEATVEKLIGEGHEAADATKQLAHLLESLAELLRMKSEAGR